MEMKWNTGRLYGAKGQRMAAKFNDDGTVVFVDIDRGLSGKFNVDFPPQNGHMLRLFTMGRYDRNEYQSTRFEDHDTITKLAELANTQD